jgi:hypothetical protein
VASPYISLDYYGSIGLHHGQGLDDSLQIVASGANLVYQFNATDDPGGASDVGALPSVTRQLYVSGASAVILTFTNRAGRKVEGYVLQPGRHSLRIRRVWATGLTIPVGVQLWAEW